MRNQLSSTNGNPMRDTVDNLRAALVARFSQLTGLLICNSPHSGHVSSVIGRHGDMVVFSEEHGQLVLEFVPYTSSLPERKLNVVNHQASITAYNEAVSFLRWYS